MGKTVGNFTVKEVAKAQKECRFNGGDSHNCIKCALLHVWYCRSNPTTWDLDQEVEVPDGN